MTDFFVSLPCFALPARRALGVALVLAAVVAVSAPAPVAAQVLANRAALNAAMTGVSVTDNFEGFTTASGGSTQLGTSTLNATSVTPAGGPNLVSPGATYVGTSTLQACAQNYYGLPSKCLLSSGAILRINFTSATGAYGLDLLAFQGFNDTVTVRTYAADGVTLLGTTSGISVVGGSPAQPNFFGYRSGAGIGAVELQGARSWSPIIDNVQFGAVSAAVPEPGSLALLATGMAGSVAMVRLRRRKKA